MKVINHLKNISSPTFSFEIVPALRGRNCQIIMNIVDELKIFNPPFIDVTSHASKISYEKDVNGNTCKKVYKKRPGTLGICGVIQNRYEIDTVAHILCRGFNKRETENALIELNYLGVKNILALRGDETNHEIDNFEGSSKKNTYAIDLIGQINDLKRGKYLDEVVLAEPLDFCIGIAGYPEKHKDSEDIDEDIKYLKEKVDAGADYIVTQMFFDNRYFYDFVKRCRKAGIKVPIIPGLKTINHVRQIEKLPKFFRVQMPNQLIETLKKNPDDAKKIGVNWCRAQVTDLISNGFNCIHFYIMNDVQSVVKIINNIV